MVKPRYFPGTSPYYPKHMTVIDSLEITVINTSNQVTFDLTHSIISKTSAHPGSASHSQSEWNSYSVPQDSQVCQSVSWLECTLRGPK